MRVFVIFRFTLSRNYVSVCSGDIMLFRKVKYRYIAALKKQKQKRDFICLFILTYTFVYLYCHLTCMLSENNVRKITIFSIYLTMFVL